MIWIYLDDTAFAGLAPAPSAPRTLTSAEFWVTDDRVIYDNATGKLYYDADGNGAAAKLLIATLTGAPALIAGERDPN